jgi:hypothetical protein
MNRNKRVRIVKYPIEEKAVVIVFRSLRREIQLRARRKARNRRKARKALIAPPLENAEPPTAYYRISSIVLIPTITQSNTFHRLRKYCRQPNPSSFKIISTTKTQ